MSDAREYQQKAINDIRDAFLGGYRKVLLWLATGGGKTFVFCRMVQGAASKGRFCIVVVRGRKLVSQASARLTREQVDHGVLMAGHWNYRPSARVQVCSIDTLLARGLRPTADLIVIDEAHLATSPGYKEFLAQYPSAFVVSVTATPWVEDSLRHIADKVVHPITMQQLTDEGFLVPFRYFAPAAPDLSGVEVSRATKDYKQDQLEGAMVAGQLTGKIIDHWQKICPDRPTILFAVNVHHSKLLVARFLSAGIPAEHCDADTPEKERADIIGRLESGETKVVSNVGILCTGVDIPRVGAIIMARPTKSRNLFVQQAGRGTRTADGKSDCVLLDHAGNIQRHGFPTDEEDVDLDGKKTETTPTETKLCKKCFAQYRGRACPECGTEAPPAPAVEIAESDDELKELQVAVDPVRQALKELIREAKRTGKKTAWAYYRLVDRFGFNEQTRPHLPQWFIDKQQQSTSSLFARSPFRAFVRDEPK